jgi:hypothetical protein
MLAPEQGERIAALQRRYHIRFETRLNAGTSIDNYEYLDILDRGWFAGGLPRPAGGELRRRGLHALQRAGGRDHRMVSVSDRQCRVGVAPAVVNVGARNAVCAHPSKPRPGRLVRYGESWRNRSGAGRRGVQRNRLALHRARRAPGPSERTAPGAGHLQLLDADAWRTVKPRLDYSYSIANCCSIYAGS